MSENKEPEEATKFESVFAESEPPEEGAIRNDEKPIPDAEVTEDGHLTKRINTEGRDLYDHSEELEAERKKGYADGTAPPDMPDREPIGVRNPAMMVDPLDGVRDEIERRFQADFGDLKVTVSAAERDAFVRAALTDTELIYEIEVEGVGIIVTVAMPPDSFTNAAQAAANKWAKDDIIDTDSDLQWLLTFQQMHALFQIRAVNGEPTEWASHWDDGLPKLGDLRALLNNPDTLHDFQKMGAVRWRLLVNAIRLAEQKYRICLSNWQDRTFFTGADTA